MRIAIKLLHESDRDVRDITAHTVHIIHVMSFDRGAKRLPLREAS